MPEDEQIEIEVEIPYSKLAQLLAGDEDTLILEKPECKLTLKRIED